MAPVQTNEVHTPTKKKTTSWLYTRNLKLHLWILLWGQIVVPVLLGSMANAWRNTLISSISTPGDLWGRKRLQENERRREAVGHVSWGLLWHGILYHIILQVIGRFPCKHQRLVEADPTQGKQAPWGPLSRFSGGILLPEVIQHVRFLCVSPCIPHRYQYNQHNNAALK